MNFANSQFEHDHTCMNAEAMKTILDRFMVHFRPSHCVIGSCNLFRAEKELLLASKMLQNQIVRCSEKAAALKERD
jgi:hypothetical protein